MSRTKSARESLNRWCLRFGLVGRRGVLFALLGLYVLGTAVYVATGGAQPAATSLAVEQADLGADDSSDPSRAAETASAAATAATAAAPEAAACDEIVPSQHSVDESLSGVHALGFMTLQEQQAAFSGYPGCPLIVNFFASWCVPCVTEMPDFERFWQSHGTEVAVLGLAANDRLADAIATVADRGVTYPTGLDEGDLFIDFGGLGMPTTVFVSPAGDIVEAHSGLLTLDDITTRAAEHFGIGS